MIDLLKESVVRLTPPPELLNVVVGVLISGSISIFSAMALTPDVEDRNRLALVGSSALLGVAASLCTVLATSLAQMDRLVTAGMGPTISAVERKELILDAKRSHAARTAILSAGTLIAVATAAVSLAAA